ncbi:MAG: hypothetical protein K9W42_10305 [Candidatus Heimdallarchaeota archaeon]|nr:hypothetical protein [Candidatus Heimdallarchaeota archaeon]
MKCCYHPDQEAEGSCAYCAVPLCKTCLVDAKPNNGYCLTCLRQKQFARTFNYLRLLVWFAGIAWMILAYFIFEPTQGDDWSYALAFSVLGPVVAVIINRLMFHVFIRLLLSNLEPQQRFFVALFRYSLTGKKSFFTQAVNALKRVPNPEYYKDAFYEQLIAVLILQPFALPAYWSDHLSSASGVKEEELLCELLTYGREIFLENIFKNHHYQAITTFIELLEKTALKDPYNELIDSIMARLESVDLEEIKRYQPHKIANRIVLQAKQEEPQKVLVDKAFLTELKLIEEDLEIFFRNENRSKDWRKIAEITKQLQLPMMPKATFEAARYPAINHLSWP